MLSPLSRSRRAFSLILPAALALAPQSSQDAFRRDFSIPASALSHTGRSRWFILEPGHQSTFSHGNEKLVITVRPETKLIDGIETRVVEERETKAGALVEVSRNYFAINPQSGDVYYFGEDVDMYRDGKITSHEGAWRSGVNGARYGLMVAGVPTIGMRHYQEIAPRVAMDRVQVVSMSEKRTIAGITYTNVMKVEETTPLEPGVREYKWYAPGIGLIVDGDLELVRSVIPVRK